MLMMRNVQGKRTHIETKSHIKRKKKTTSTAGAHAVACGKGQGTQEGAKEEEEISRRGAVGESGRTDGGDGGDGDRRKEIRGAARSGEQGGERSSRTNGTSRRAPNASLLSRPRSFAPRDPTTHATHDFTLLTQARAAEARLAAQDAARRSNIGALGGATFRDSTSIGGGSNAT